MIGTFYMTGSLAAFVIPLPMSLPLLSALLLSLSVVLCIIGIRIVFAILILLLLRFMRLLKNIFFSKQTEMTMTKCHILRSRKAQQISICNDVILKICRDKYCKFLFQVQRLSFPGCAWQDPLPRRWLWSNGLQFFKYKTFPTPHHPMYHRFLI